MPHSSVVRARVTAAILVVSEPARSIGCRIPAFWGRRRRRMSVGMTDDGDRIPRLARAGPPRRAARRRCSTPSRSASPRRCAPTTSRRGASGRATPASPGRGSAPRWPRRRCRSASVNAPGQRYHPAIVAQAIATLAAMFPGRFWVALGTGEASNEHITGDGWPRKERARRPAARVRRRHPRAARRRGGQPRRAGHRRPGPPLDAARAAAAADRRRGQRRRPRALGARAGPTAWSPSTSRTTHLREMIAAYRDAGGRGPARPAGAPVLRPRPTDRALAIAHDQWRSNVFAAAGLLGPRHRRGASTQASAHVTPEDVARGRCSSPATSAQHAAWLARARRARLRRASTCTTSARSSAASSTRSASTCCPQLDVDAPDAAVAA